MECYEFSHASIGVHLGLPVVPCMVRVSLVKTEQ